MKRREFITLLGGVGAALVRSPSAGLAQARPARIGFVAYHSPLLAGHVDHLREGLRQLGHVEGRTYEIEVHFTDGDRKRTQEVLQAMVQKGVDVVLVWTSVAIQIAKEMTQSVPLVMIISGDPVAAGFVQSLSHPGGNITGVTMTGDALAGKRLELLREILPSIRTVGYLSLQGTPASVLFVKETRTNAEKIGLNVVVRAIPNPGALDAALFEGMKRDGIETVIVQPIFTGQRERIMALANASRLPVIADYTPFADAGALATLGVNEGNQVRRTAYYIDRVLKGAKPADLPIEQPTTFELVINLKTAKAFGIEVPPLLIARADKVIE